MLCCAGNAASERTDGGGRAQVNRDFPRRAAAPTITQITLIRRMMHTIFDPRAAGMQGGFFGAEKDLKKEWVSVWEEFYSQSFFFPVRASPLVAVA